MRIWRPEAKLTALALAAYFVAMPRVLEGPQTSLPPVTDDVVFARTHGSEDIKISELQTCGCWSGPRGQAQKKYKFRIENRSPYRINIGGGVRSNLRLVVAFPNGSNPTTSIPQASEESFQVTAAMPAGVELLQATDSERFEPPTLDGANQTFGVDESWQIVLYPPNENRVIEDLYGATDTEIGTFPTYVEDEWLDPGESFWDGDYGEGAWVFYVPVTEELVDLVVPPSSQLTGDEIGDAPRVLSAGFGSIRRDVYSKAINILGVAVINPGSGELLGFAPTPTDSMFSSPDDF